jgi:DedD protein
MKPGQFMDRRVKERLIGATILLGLIVLVVPELLSGPHGRVASPAALPAAGPSEPMRNVTVDLATSKSTAAADPTAAADASGAGDATAAADTAAAASAARSAAETAPAAAPAPRTAAPATAAAGMAAPSPAASDSPASDPAAAAVAGTSAAPAGGAASAAQGSAAAASALAPPSIATLKAQQSAPAVLENDPPAPSGSEAAPNGRATAENPGVPVRHGWTVQVGSFANRANADKLLRRMKALDESAHVASSGRGEGVRYRVRIGPLADRHAAERALAKLRKEGVSGSLVGP